ncbi:MAG TPA: hypothetical protein PLD99_00870 [Parcubacteria group bacterium]|nr:hypothetical protein [Parcubacteria group bacterium]
MPQPNVLFKSQRFNLTRFMASLSRMGLELNRAHMKRNDGQGKTGQIMLVFEKGMPPMSKAKYDELVGTFIGLEGAEDTGFAWTVQAFDNEAISRVPAHVFINCGNPQEKKGDEPNLSMRIQKLADVAKKKTMVRIAFNLYPDEMHLIPSWVTERPRHTERVSERESAAELLEATQGF